MNNCYFYDKTAAIFMQYQNMAIKGDYVIMRRTYTQVFSNRKYKLLVCDIGEWKVAIISPYSKIV